MDDLCDTLSRESLLPEPPLDVIEDLGVRRVGLVQDVLEAEIRLPKAITEVLRENPSTIRVCRFLHSVCAGRSATGVEERVVGQAVQ